MTSEHSVPDAADRAVLNAYLLATGADTGFWDEPQPTRPRPDESTNVGPPPATRSPPNSKHTFLT
jgi:hypothetical protein